MSTATSCSRRALLAVPQIREAHALCLDPEAADPTALVVAPPYPGMQVGDRATFRFAPDNGDPPTDKVFVVEPQDVDGPLRWVLESEAIWSAWFGRADISYTVEQADGTLASATQTLVIDAPDVPLLAPATVQGAGGPALDPGQFPEGVTLRVPLYAGATVGDDVFLYWDGYQAARSTVKWHALDAADVDAGAVLMQVEPKWLVDNIGRDVTVRYQYARVEAAESSEPLVLTILVPVVLDPPKVEGALGEGGSGENKGYIMAEDALYGVYITVPEADELDDVVRIEMVWEGHPSGGQHVATEPTSPGTPLKFEIPATAVAANIGGESKRFPVYYRAVMASGATHTSLPFLLWVKPLDQGDYSAPQCREAEGKLGLSLADVPAEGAEVYVGRYSFNVPGHLMTLWITGVAAGGGAVEHIARDALPVTQAELDARTIAGRLPRAVLQELEVNSRFTLRAKVSYDGGDTAIAFRTHPITWLG